MKETERDTERVCIQPCKATLPPWRLSQFVSRNLRRRNCFNDSSKSPRRGSGQFGMNGQNNTTWEVASGADIFPWFTLCIRQMLSIVAINICKDIKTCVMHSNYIFLTIKSK